MIRPRERWALLVLLAAAAVLYLFNLAATGYGNTFYAAAAQAGAKSWTAWFFGSLDAHNFITVDKPPASLWVTGLSVRLFGMNSWAVLAPQAVMGVASVAVLYFVVRRTFSDPRQGAAAGLLAGAVLALTPAAALMFRFNNPDALLVLLLTAAAYCVMRAVPAASWRWLALAGAVMGFAFLTKMFQGFLVLPGFALAYLLFAPTGWAKRALHLLTTAAAVVVAAGWWVLAVQLVPADARPYVGGSTDNTVLDLAFGYNGISRIVGRHSERTQLGDWHGAHLSMFGTRTGLHRLFTGEMANEIAWLLAAALFVVAFGAYLGVRRSLDRSELCALTMWGCWLVVTGVVLSYMGGTIHPYYTVAMAPAVAALIGLGGTWAWRRRAQWDGRLALAAIVALAAIPSAILLYRNHFAGTAWPWLIAVLAGAAAVTVVLPHPRLTAAGTTVGMLAGLAGTATVAVITAATPHHGSIPSATRSAVTGDWVALEGADAELAGMLAATHTPWSAATNGSLSAAALEIASGTSVMAVGGWATDPVPDLQGFIDAVHAGKVSYYVEAGKGTTHGEVIRGPNRSSSHAREIADWVATHYRGTTIGRSTVYRLV